MTWPLKPQELIIVRHGDYNHVDGSLTEEGIAQLTRTAKTIENLTLQRDYIVPISSIELRAVNTALFLREKLDQKDIDKRPHFSPWLLTHIYLCDGTDYDGNGGEEPYKDFLEFMNHLPGGGGCPCLLVTHKEVMETLPSKLLKDSFGKEFYSQFGYGEGIFINSSGDYKEIHR